MNLWQALEQRISEHGVRVEQRLALLARLQADHETGSDSVAQQQQALFRAAEAAAADIEALLRR